MINNMTEEQYDQWLASLDRQYAPDEPETPEEAKWLEERMKEVESK